MLWTAQYRYPGPDRLDITVKGSDPIGCVFAPTWDMVRKYQNGQEGQDTYTERYWTLMKERLQDVNEAVKWILSKDQVTLVCFCTAGSFCHRILVAKLLDKNIPKITYQGERKL
jgi:hypothetical protein